MFDAGIPCGPEANMAKYLASEAAIRGGQRLHRLPRRLRLRGGVRHRAQVPRVAPLPGRADQQQPGHRLRRGARPRHARGRTTRPDVQARSSKASASGSSRRGPEYFPAYQRWFADMEVTRYLLYRFPFTTKWEEEWLEQVGRDPHQVYLGHRAQAQRPPDRQRRARARRLAQPPRGERHRDRREGRVGQGLRGRDHAPPDPLRLPRAGARDRRPPGSSSPTRRAGGGSSGPAIARRGCCGTTTSWTAAGTTPGWVRSCKEEWEASQETTR